MAASEPERLLDGRYRLHAIIGRGGMGAVWRAYDELLNRDVAVKEIIWPPYMDPEEREVARQRAVREAQMAGRLHHPNVVNVYDIIEEDDRASIVMEFVPYQSLRDAIRKDGPLSPARAAQVGLGVLAGLRAAHDAGVVHRDVKPANILLGPQDQVVLTDFGIAKAVDSPALTMSGVLIGSPSYTAPERARGGQAGAPADLWALGASLYAAVEGRPPFEREGALASLTAIVSDEPDPPQHAGPLWPVISGLLVKDPDTRLGIAETEQMLLRVAQENDTTHGGVSPQGPAPADVDYGPPLDCGPPESGSAEEASGPSEPAAAAGAEPAASPRLDSRRRYRAALVALVAVIAAAVIAVAAALVLTRSPGRHLAAPPSSLRASAPASARTSPTAAPSGATPSSSPTATPGNSGSMALPTGYYRFTNSTGFSVGVPQGWQISHVGHYVYIRDPGDSAIFLLIDQSDHPNPDPLANWEQQAAARESTYPDYHLILLESVDYAPAEKAADWEFTYDRDGVGVRVLNRNVLANAHHAYALYWSTPTGDWNAYYHFFQAFAATFRPASIS